MRRLLMPFATAALLTLLVGASVSIWPVFPGDVELTRTVQDRFPDARWAAAVSQFAVAPAKYGVMVLAVIASYGLGGWRGLVVGGFAIALDQYGTEAVKPLVARPRPSPDLVRVVGAPSGFSFPSGTMTFFSATFGWMLLMAARATASRLRLATWILAPAVLAAAGVARIVVGAHWPSDVVLTTVVCLMWLWATARALFPR